MNLDNNQLREIPASISELKLLRIVNLSRNFLTELPEGFNSLQLTQIRVDHNLLEKFDDGLFSNELGQSLMLFSCHDNNILQLPQSIIRLRADTRFSADSNPLISPPASLLIHGLTIVQQYMWNRGLRIQDLVKLLEENDFEIDEEAVGPIAYEVLVDGTDLLHPRDMTEFDRAVDEFLNGAYYNVNCESLTIACYMIYS